ncbi:MAG: hypothetical protein LBU53_03130, partial [Zoogloeaceae bacterium]|nr:hypothetical protein [Zoogloeaceae bacterium]
MANGNSTAEIGFEQKIRVKRKPNRLTDYDYSQNGAYFITICAKDRAGIFSTIEAPDRIDDVGANCVRPNMPDNVRPQLSPIGIIIEKEIKALSKIYDQVAVDGYVVMPNHVHIIIVIGGAGIESGRTQFAPTVSRVVKQWKGAITKQPGFSPWQKSFHDRIIRNEEEYTHIAEYIETNPARWSEDCFYVDANRMIPVGANCVRPRLLTNLRSSFLGTPTATKARRRYADFERRLPHKHRCQRGRWRSQ